MRAIIALVIILGLAFLVQITILNRVTLLNGSVDLILVILAAWALQENARYTWVWGIVAGLVIGGISVAPWYIYVLAYLAVIALARLLTRRIWQAPLLAMFAITFVGTLIVLLSTYAYRIFFDVSLSFSSAFSQVILPGVLLNLLLSIIIHPLMRDLAARIYPTDMTS